MIKRGYAAFVVDLSECLGMDSTFLGVLAGIGLRLSQRGQPGKIYIVNANQRSLELLETLGLDRLFGIETRPVDTVRHEAPVEFQRLPDSDVIPPGHPINKDDTADLMLEAHENLIRADKRNEPKFKDLTRFLRERAEHHKPPDAKSA